jgi:hypothetical protein
MKDNEPSPRRGSSDSNRPEGFYVRYLRQLAERHAEHAADLEFDEKYWRERERLHAEENLPLKRAA